MKKQYVYIINSSYGILSAHATQDKALNVLKDMAKNKWVDVVYYDKSGMYLEVTITGESNFYEVVQLEVLG